MLPVRLQGALKWAAPDAFSSMACRALAARDKRPATLHLLLSYFAAPPPGESQERVRANELLFRNLLRGDVTALRMVATACTNRAWPHVDLALVEAARGAWPEVVREAEAASASDGNDSGARALHAYALARDRRFGEALRVLEEDSSRGEAVRNVSLLRAHAYRLARRYDLAGDCFTRAHAVRALTGDDALCHAEVLWNRGRIGEARTVLTTAAVRRDSRWTALALVIAGCDSDAGELLDAIPLTERNDLYWRLRSNELVERGDVPGAIEALENIDDQRDDDVRQSKRLAQLQFGRLYCSRQDRAILAALDEHVPAELLPIGVSALLRHAKEELTGGVGRARKAWNRVESVLRSNPGLTARPDVAIARALLCVAAEQVDAAYAQLRALRHTDGEASLQYALCALLLGDTEECNAALAAIDSRDRAACLAAACSAVRGDYDEARRLTDGCDGHSQYYAAIQAALSGRHDLAAACLGSLLQDRTFRPAARRLLAYVRICEARAGGVDAGATLDEAFALLGRHVSAAQAGLFPWLLEADARRAAHAALTAFSDVPHAPEHCHRLGIFHLCEAERYALASEWEIAIASVELAIACLAIPLSDPYYLAHWIEARCRVYGEDKQQNASSVADGIVAHLRETIESWQEILSARGELATAAHVADLSLTLRAELRGAALLRAADRHSQLPCAMGFLGLRRFRLERRFDTFLARLRKKEGADSAEEIERFFSSLRQVAVLDEAGQAGAALDRLRREAGGRHPADGEVARRMETSLLLRLAEREVSSSEDSINAGIEHWRQAFALARNGTRAAVVEAIHRVAFGRAHALEEGDRSPEAIRLLEGVNDICGDEAVLGELSAVLAHAAVASVNRGESLQGAVEGLRRARELNRHSPHINRNLVVALSNRVDEVIADDRDAALELLREARQIAEASLRVDPTDSEMQELVWSFDARLSSLSLGGGLTFPVNDLPRTQRQELADALLRMIGD